MVLLKWFFKKIIETASNLISLFADAYDMIKEEVNE